mgnify:CR=1 FL=1
MEDKIFFAGYMYSFAGGFFGATFFMIRDLQSKLAVSEVATLRDMWTYGMILLRCCFGIGAATILYFFFQTGLLGQGVWPAIPEIGFETLDSVWRGGGFESFKFTLPNKDTALLIVWSFLAGYSQRLVPSFLSRTEERAGEKPPVSL